MVRSASVTNAAKESGRKGRSTLTTAACLTRRTMSASLAAQLGPVLRKDSTTEGSKALRLASGVRVMACVSGAPTGGQGAS